MPNADDHRSLAKGIFVNWIGIAAKSTRPLFLIVFSQFLGVENFGLYMLAFSLQEIVGKFGGLGVNQGIMYLAGRLRGEGRERESRPVVEKVVLIGMLSSAGVGILLAAVAGWVSASILGKPELAAPLRIFSIGIPAVVGTYTLLYAIRPSLEMRYEVYAQSIFEPLMILAIGTGMLKLGLGVSGIAAAHVLAAVATFALSFYFFIRVYPTAEKIRDGQIPWGDFWKNGLAMGGVDALSAFKQKIDLLVIGRFLPLAQVGIYSAVIEIASALRKTRSAFDPIMMPITQRLYQQGEQARLREHFSLAIRWGMIPAFAILGLMLLVPELFLHFFGDQFTVGARSLGILAIGQLFHVTLGLLESALLITGFAHVTLINSVVLVVGNLILLLFAIPRWGIVGAAVATSVSFVLVTVWRLFQARERFGVWPFDHSQIKPLGAFLLAIAVGFVLKWAFPTSTLPVLVARLLVFLFLYAVFLFVFGPEPEDRDIFGRVKRRIRRNKNAVNSNG